MAAKDPEKNRRRCVQYLASHREQNRLRCAAYRARDREAASARDREYYRTHKEARRAYGREQYREKGEERRRVTRDWCRAHPCELRAYSSAYRARKRSASGRWWAQDIRTLRVVLGSLCPACGKRRSGSIDHVIPLARGGSNHPTNLQFLCNRCNSSKSTTRKDFRTKEQRQRILRAFQLQLFKDA